MENTEKLHPMFTNPESEDTEDGDPQNMDIRAGYLVGMSMRYPEGTKDRLWLHRAARSMASAASELTALRAKASCPTCDGDRSVPSCGGAGCCEPDPCPTCNATWLAERSELYQQRRRANAGETLRDTLASASIYGIDSAIAAYDAAVK